MSVETIQTPFERELDQESTDQDLVRIYLNEIGRFPLLNAQEEVELGKAIEIGLMARRRLEETEVESEQFMSDKERELLLIVQEEGRQANETMINSNLRLVVSIAKKYQDRGLSFLDLIQFGNEGLMHAIEKFDYQKGYKFSTYANNWIRQRILKGLGDDARTIRIPLHKSDQINKLNRIERELIAELNRQPTPEELAAEMNDEVEAIRELQDWKRIPTSINAELPGGRHGGVRELGDVIIDDQSADPADFAMMTIMREQLIEAIQKHATSDRNRDLIMAYFGLSGPGPNKLSYTAIAGRFGMSIQNAHKIVHRTLERIGEHESHLRSYWQD